MMVSRPISPSLITTEGMWQSKSCCWCHQQYKKTAHDLNTQPFQRKHMGQHQAIVGPQASCLC